MGLPGEDSLKTGGIVIFSLEDITVVVLSRGRERQLLRSIHYWNQTKLRVVILHNTQAPLPTDSFASNIHYIVSEKDFAGRCEIAASEINTRYAIFCADDELLLPSGLSSMGTYLENHLEFSSVGGKTIGVGKYGKNLTATYTYQNMVGYSNLGNSIFERLESHTFGQVDYRTGAMYRLMRTELMTKLLCTFSELSVMSTPYIFEVTGEIVVNGLGKTVYLDELYWVRNWINEQVEHKNWNRRLYFQKWRSSEEYGAERATWIELLTSLSDDTDSYRKFSHIVEGLNQKRRILETRELKAKSKLRNKVPDWPKKIRRNLTPRKLVVNSIDHFLEDQIGSYSETAAELRTALTFLE